MPGRIRTMERAGVCLWFMGLAWMSSATIAGEQTPELAVLNRFIGTWVCESSNSPTENNPTITHLTTVDVSKWTLDGNFVEIQIEIEDKRSAKVLIGYNRQTKSYHSWTFTSSGGFFENKMKWDEETRTFSGQYEVSEGVTCKTHARFVDDNTYEWHWIATDTNGKVYFDMKGIKKRK